MRDFIMLICAIVCGVFGCILTPFNMYLRYQCNSYEEITGIETRYNNFDTCYLNTPHGWMRWDEYLERNKGVDSAKEIFK